MSLTARLGVRQLIWALSLLGIVGIAALAGVYFTTAALLAREEAVADGAAKIERLVLTLDSQLLEARRAEKDYLLRTDERYVTRHAEIAERSTALLGAIEKKLTSPDDAVMRDLLTGGRTGFGAYLRAFQVVVAAQRKLGHDENSGLQGSLRNSVRDAEAQLAKANEKELTILMLMMRRHEKDFILREDARYLGEMKKRGEEFASSLKASSLGDAARESVSAKMAAYQKDFASYAAANTEKADAVKALSKAYADVEPVFNTLHEAVEKRYRDASASIAAVRARTDTLMIGGVAAVLVILVVVGQLIARNISRPIAALAATTKALSEGDLSVEVGGRSRRDEIGMMAQSLDVFRAAMIESRRLEDASKAREAETSA
ncbi:MAG TPA: HAMP domain-containing protein, partial [Beijerinckiaceae bacterium]|nr:HAMP domain-containing protein [Beijerinckiaceae bacterium]